MLGLFDQLVPFFLGGRRVGGKFKVGVGRDGPGIPGGEIPAELDAEYPVSVVITIGFGFALGLGRIELSELLPPT